MLHARTPRAPWAALSHPRLSTSRLYVRIPTNQASIYKLIIHLKDHAWNMYLNHISQFKNIQGLSNNTPITISPNGPPGVWPSYRGKVLCSIACFHGNRDCNWQMRSVYCTSHHLNQRECIDKRSYKRFASTELYFIHYSIKVSVDIRNISDV